MLEIARGLAAEGKYAAVVVSAEVGAPFPDEPVKAERAMLGDRRRRASRWLPSELQPPEAAEGNGWRGGAPDPLAEGLEQLDGYLAGLGLDSGWLVVFDRLSGQPPIAERTRAAAASSPGGRSVTVIRG